MSNKARLYGDYMSQPFRTCVLFSRVAGLDVEVVQLQIAKGQHRTAEYLKVNQLGKIPALQDSDGTCVVESATIMRYLCETRGIHEPWFPSDLRRRTKINSALDWHLNTMRIGSMVTVWNRVLARNLGQQGKRHLVEDYGLPMLKNALKQLNDVWLAEGEYVGGGSQPSCADLLMACEIEQLRLLDAADEGPSFDELLAPHPRVRTWLARLAAACSPHYQDVHSVLYKVRERMLAQKEKRAAGSRL